MPNLSRQSLLKLYLEKSPYSVENMKSESLIWIHIRHVFPGWSSVAVKVLIYGCTSEHMASC